jgi:TRAP-type uncharacterized transport system substrate-binding protein
MDRSTPTFQTTGYPQGHTHRARRHQRLRPSAAAGPEADKLQSQFKFFANDEIPAGVYKDVAGVKTLSVGAQWVTSPRSTPIWL